MRAAADEDDADLAERLDVVEYRLDRLAVPDRHRRERHLEDGRRAVPAGECDRMRFGGDPDEAAIARGEPSDPAGQAIRGYLDGSPTPGHRPPAHHPRPRRPPPTHRRGSTSLRADEDRDFGTGVTEIDSFIRADGTSGTQPQHGSANS